MLASISIAPCHQVYGQEEGQEAQQGSSIQSCCQPSTSSTNQMLTSTRYSQQKTVKEPKKRKTAMAAVKKSSKLVTRSKRASGCLIRFDFKEILIFLDCCCLVLYGKAFVALLFFLLLKNCCKE
uniref:Uncharacterized protein n=1 Tax=Ditylenchus dipsaci TaxID=166011 RepID=A0A915DGQ2_9BILA